MTAHLITTDGVAQPCTREQLEEAFKDSLPATHLPPAPAPQLAHAFVVRDSDGVDKLLQPGTELRGSDRSYVVATTSSRRYLVLDKTTGLPVDTKLRTQAMTLQRLIPKAVKGKAARKAQKRERQRQGLSPRP